MADRKIKVIHINHRDDAATGGALRVAYELVRRLPNYDIDARMLFLYGSKGYFGSQMPERSDYLHICRSSHVWQLGRFRSYLKAVKPDIVHFHDDLLWTQLLTVGRRPWKTVIHAHGGGTPKPQPVKTRTMYAIQRRYADAVVCITQDAQNSQIRNVGFCPELVHVIYNGVDTDHFYPPSPEDQAAARMRFGLPPQAKVVGFIGRLHDVVKGCSDFIELVAALPEDYTGLVAGTGPDAEELHRQAASLGVSHRICFAGLLDNPLPAYQAMSVFCFMSKFDGFGLTIAEAMACGVPVVGFRCPGGSGEILTNETGVVIEHRDITAMAAAVRNAVQGSESWHKRIAEAKDVIVKKFNWHDAAKRLSILYHSIISGDIKENE